MMLEGAEDNDEYRGVCSAIRLKLLLRSPLVTVVGAER